MIAGHVPSEMVKCLAAFLDFCYVVRRNAITAEDLTELQVILDRFHFHRTVFIDTAGVTGENISLPRQHSLMHYIRSIMLFGSPNGLCSSITESKHIKAMKEPWRRSSRFKALKQMLLTNSRMDKLSSASRAHTELGMMDGTTSSYTEMILRGEQPQVRAAAADAYNDEDNDNSPEPGPKALSSIKLAHSPGMSFIHIPFDPYTDQFYQREGIHKQRKLLQTTSTSPNLSRCYDDSCTTKSTPIRKHHRQTSHWMSAQGLLGPFPSTIPQLPTSMHRAIFAALVDCIENVSVPTQTGMGNMLAMTQCSSR